MAKNKNKYALNHEYPLLYKNIISINSNVQVHVQKQIYAYLYEIYDILTKGQFSIGEGLTFLVTMVTKGYI